MNKCIETEELKEKQTKSPRYFLLTTSNDDFDYNILAEILNRIPEPDISNHL